jgi:hypothetical protein
MVQLIAILLAAYIVIPLVDLVAAERVRYALRLIVYLLTFLFVVYTLWKG